ncbi:transporter substrate-binding protein [Tepidibacillus sp. LV47]|uniref:transporter substrate-binding protein n=1 Tax=Tepidibacillus sp. LV47 TaxID=3398228 RepID=UPI003AAFC449
MEKIKIGLLFSLSGTTANTEYGQYLAALYAFEEYKQKNSHLPFDLEIEVRDIQSDPNVTKKEAKNLAEKGVKLMIGCYTSACRKAVLPILEEYQCLLIYPSLYEGYEIHPNVFYTGEVPNQQILLMLSYIISHFGKKFFLIGTNYIYPHLTNQQVHDYLNQLNGEVVGEHYVPFGYAQFTNIFQEIIENKPNVILSTIVGTSIIPFYRTYYEMGIEPQKLPIFSPITTETEINGTFTKIFTGHYSCAGYFQSIDTVTNREYVKKFKRLYGDDIVISSNMTNTYLGVKMLLDAIINIKTLEYTELINYLKGKTFEGPSGKVKIDIQNQHISRKMYIGKANENGQFTIVWKSDELISPSPYSNEINVLNKEESSWQTMIEECGKDNNEAIIVVNHSGSILFKNEKAKEIIGEKMLLDEIYFEQLKKSYKITKQKIVTNKNAYLILLKKMDDKMAKQLNDEEVYTFHRIKTKNKKFIDQLKIAEIAATSDVNILILGETGTGKEVLARAIHEKSKRREGPFITVNAAAIPRELVASELFGYVEGAYTGARKGGAIGKFEAANKGTLFLDEIGDMPIDIQVNLLRAVETRKIIRVGDHIERPIDVRIIAATNRNLKEEIAYNGSFRSDLYYRLNVFTITIPPLRDRSDDIELIVLDYLKQFYNQYKNGPNRIDKEVVSALKSYYWPGNIRELRNVIERAFILSLNEEELTINHLPDEIKNFNKKIEIKTNRELLANSLSIKENEKVLIEQVIKNSHSITEAAKKLGIARSSIYRKIKEYNISIRDNYKN